MQQRLYWSFQVNRISFRELLMTSLDTWLKMMSPRSLDDFPTKRLEDYVHLRALPAGWSWFQWFLLGGASHSVNVSKKSSHINGMSLLTYGIIWDMYIYNQLYTYIHGYVIYGNMDIYIYYVYIYMNYQRWLYMSSPTWVFHGPEAFHFIEHEPAFKEEEQVDASDQTVGKLCLQKGEHNIHIHIFITLYYIS